MDEFDLTPDGLLAAYRSGVFPMAEQRDGEIFWCAPELRGILEFDEVRISRSLRKVLRGDRFIVTSDNAFSDVIAACAERDETWISPAIETAYGELHRRGFAHSVEVWESGLLVGGLYGVSIGGAFCGESMFHKATDASKVALVHLVRHLGRRGYQLLDCQFVNPHLISLGASEIPRSEYLDRLKAASALAVTFGVLDPTLTVSELNAVSEQSSQSSN